MPETDETTIEYQNLNDVKTKFLANQYSLFYLQYA